MKFKIKLTKKDRVEMKDFSKGLYSQLKTGNRIAYNKGDFKIEDIKAAFTEVFNKPQPKQREVKMITATAGYDLFKKAVEEQFREEQLKTHKNEYRKRLSIKSKIFKQTN